MRRLFKLGVIIAAVIGLYVLATGGIGNVNVPQIPESSDMPGCSDSIQITVNADAMQEVEAAGSKTVQGNAQQNGAEQVGGDTQQNEAEQVQGDVQHNTAEQAPNTASARNDSKTELPDRGQETEKRSITKQRLVCIDPGHQKKANCDKEPIAPASTVMKEKMSWGTMGVATGVPEYKLNLEVSMKLKNVLEKSGIKVLMTRESNDVNSGNIERAKMANDCNADLVVRIHADGMDNSKAKGVSVLYPGDKYIKDAVMLSRSKNAALSILKSIVSHTGAASRGVIKRDDMTGFNWSKVPVMLIEMGFMTNPEEDRLLNSSEYQDKIVQGIAEGINKYFEGIESDLY